MKPKREANTEFLRRRQKRLRENGSALEWLLEQGLNSETVELFNLGLAEAYTSVKGVRQENALLAPVRNENGIFTSQTIYINIEGVTMNPTGAADRAKGTPRLYYAEKYDAQTSLLLCEDVWDLWLTQQALRENKSKLNLLLVCSTPNEFGAQPDEWRKPDFWSRFETVYLGHRNSVAGDKAALKISDMIAREARRLRPSINFGESWAEFWRNGGMVKEFYRLISDASFTGAQISPPGADGNLSPGRYGYKPVDIGTAFHRGNLYYPVRTLVNSLENCQGESIPQLTARTETVVVRSDRTIHTVNEEQAPRGTPPEERILRLTDGTLIESHPRASVYSTWSWSSIDLYHRRQSRPRPLRKILNEVKQFLKNSVWLPYSYDYDLLTLLTPVTYAQAVFQSVPMILVVGVAGSGKSALGRAMCRICANAVPIGQTSAAAIARLIHETKGFVLLDDLESIGKRPKTERPQLNELLQALKVSYNKDTSWKIWINVSRGMRQERLNFFGVKMINNTTGSDDILGSRMLKIHTAKIPSLLMRQLENNDFGINPGTDSLRDELHTWTFENVALIDATYKRLFPRPTDRSAEIIAPLRVFAEIAEDSDLMNGLNTALEAKNETVQKPDDPIEVMIQVVKNLVRKGFRQLATTHVALEMKSIMNLNPAQDYKPEQVKWDNPAWVGRHLRTYNLIDTNAVGSRQWLFGKLLRVYPVKIKLVEKILSENETPVEFLEKQPLDFCQGCARCSYRYSACPIMKLRLDSEMH